MKKKEGVPYQRSSFRAEFCELFKASEQYDLTGSGLYQISLCNSDGEEIDYRHFRITWQKDNKKGGKRFRLVPYKKDEKTGKTISSKLSMPVLYVGLSRLYPIGEVGDSEFETNSLVFDNDIHRDWFCNHFQRILSQDGNIVDISSASINNINNKKVVGISTDTYDALANSAGQDNLGQILLALLSFKRYSDSHSQDVNYKGGLLLIDELDCTLHPAAQNRLFKLMFEIAKEASIQIVFTTHSLSLLDYICKRVSHNNEERINNIELYYFTTANRFLDIRRNCSFSFVKNDLLIQQGELQKIKVYSEDAENREFFKKLVDENLSQLEIIEVNLGCSNLLDLYRADSIYFSDVIIVFDGDVKKEEIQKRIPHYSEENTLNILKLPEEGIRPEKVLYSYILSLESDHEIWSRLELYNMTWLIFKENGPANPEYECGKKERERYKSWYRESSLFIPLIIEYWINDHPEKVNEFKEKFYATYNNIAKRLAYPLLR